MARAIEAATAGDADLAGRARPSRLTLWLPGDKANPSPSPRIAGGPPHGDAVSAGVEPWTVPTLAFDPGAAIRLLVAGMGRSEETSGDASLDYLAASVMFALELAARGRFLPGLVPTRDGRGFEARWLPVPGATDAERLQALARAMPPSCRAEVGPADRHGRGAGDVLAQVLTDVVDSVARSSLGPRPFPGAAARAKRTAPIAAVLDALATASPATLSNTDDISALAGTIAAWRRRAAAGDPGFRTCFRIVPPDDGAERAEGHTWALEVLLQATDDPSLLVPAADHLARARAAGLGWPLPDGLDDAALESALFASAALPPPQTRPLPDWAAAHREVRRKWVTLQLDDLGECRAARRANQDRLAPDPVDDDLRTDCATTGS